MDHPPLDHSYLIVVPTHDMSGALILLTGLLGLDSMAGTDINPSSMGLLLHRSYLVVVPSYYMSCALILLTGLNRCDSMAGNDANLSSMGLIFGACIGPTLRFPRNGPSAIGPQLFGSSAFI